MVLLPHRRGFICSVQTASLPSPGFIPLRCHSVYLGYGVAGRWGVGWESEARNFLWGAVWVTGNKIPK